MAGAMPAAAATHRGRRRRTLHRRCGAVRSTRSCEHREQADRVGMTRGARCRVTRFAHRSTDFELIVARAAAVFVERHGPIVQRSIMGTTASRSSRRPTRFCSRRVVVVHHPGNSSPHKGQARNPSSPVPGVASAGRCVRGLARQSWPRRQDLRRRSQPASNRARYPSRLTGPVYRGRTALLYGRT